MANINWKNATSGTWDASDGTVWDAGIVPGSGDVAALSVLGTYTVTLATDATIQSLVLGGPGATVSLAFDATAARTLTVTSGSLFLNDGSKITIGAASGQSIVADIEIEPNTLIDMLAANAATITTQSTGLFMQGGTIAMGHADDLIDATKGGIAFDGGGTIAGQGDITGAISGNGGLISAGDNVRIDINSADIAGSNTLQIGNGGTIGVVDTTIGATNITFTGATGKFEVMTASDLVTTGTISGMQVGSGKNTATTTISFTGFTIKSAKFDSTKDQLTIVDAADDSQTTLQLSDYGSGTFANWTGGTLFLTDTVCYAAGTRILTEHGDVMVEDLRPGDQVVVLDGDTRSLLPVTWIGTRHVDLASHPRAELVAPVRIAKGAFAANIPARDLLVSPPHAIRVDDHLIPAKLLVNGMTITRDSSLASVTYFHVELERHAVILAEGLPAESYLDTGNRAFFSNAAISTLRDAVYHVDDAQRIWQEQACLPLMDSHRDVRPSWEALAERALALGHARPSVTTTVDPDLHLRVDGRRIDPITVTGRVYRFVLPGAARDIRLISRSTAPSDVCGWHDDDRTLGVALRSLTMISRDGEAQVLAADCPMLTDGWHAPERDGTSIWRWTTGDAALAVSGLADARILDIRVADTATYITGKAEPARLAA